MNLLRGIVQLSAYQILYGFNDLGFIRLTHVYRFLKKLLEIGWFI